MAARLTHLVAAAQELLGEQFWGWLVTNRGSASTWYPTWRRQLCWAHLLRDIEAMIQRGGRSAEIREAFQAQARLFDRISQRILFRRVLNPPQRRLSWIT